MHRVVILEDGLGFWLATAKVRPVPGGLVFNGGQVWARQIFKPTDRVSAAGMRIYRSDQPSIRSRDGCTCDLHRPGGWLRPLKLTKEAGH